MTAIQHTNDCVPINTTITVPKRVRDTYTFLATVSLLALLVNTFALIVLARRRAVRLGSMRINLITLTIFEMLLNLSIFTLISFRLTSVSDNGRHTGWLILDMVPFCVLGGALCTRNWIITLIALVRCVAVTRPVTNHLMSTHLFRPKPLAVCTIGCFIIGFVLGSLRVFEMKIYICDNLNQTTRYEAAENWRVLTDIYFVFQSAMPISIVFITTMIMIFVLLRAKKLKLEHLGDSQSSKRITCSLNRLRCTTSVRQTYLHAEKQMNFRRTQNQLRATRMIALLATAFILFEAPIFFCVILKNQFESANFYFITTALKALVVLDSCANVIIYLFMSKRFRQESARLWKGFSSKPTYGSSTQIEAVH